MELVFFFAMDFAAIYQSVCLSKWSLNSFHVFLPTTHFVICSLLGLEKYCNSEFMAHQDRQLGGLLDLRK